MKYALVIPDGMADEPQPELGGRTPLQTASVPFMDEVARCGVVGRADHVPHSMPSGSDVGTMSLFGYDPLRFHTGRAPLEAAAQGIVLEPEDWAIRCNLVTIEQGQMRSFTAGQIRSSEAAELLDRLQQALPDRFGLRAEHWRFVPGVSYRNLLLYRAGGTPAPFGPDTRTTPPHDVTDQDVGPFLPQGPGSDVLRELMKLSEELFAEAEPNRRRAAAGELPATSVWLWGQGRAPQLPPFVERFGVRGAVITAVDLLRGIGRLIGWEVIEVPGATGYLDTDYAAKGRHAVEALRDFDLVVVHVEATDEASHEGDVKAKIAAAEQIDRHIVGPLLEALRRHGEYRLMVCPDHPTFLRTKTHSHGFVPFGICGSDLSADACTSYDEAAAEASPLVFQRGHELMPFFLGTQQA
ncbi:MAG: cofactor-independent phosphoglycerate mutase [Planctomycetota bacterium]|nr:MAG: cofactor-independent phosphoglycerate mutase [Planctomycetota bacterium]